jgi:hypothetical protein
MRVLDRLARFDELQLYAMIIGPLVESLAAEFRPVIGLNYCRETTGVAQALQHLGNALAGQRDVNFDGEALPAPLVEYGKGPKPAATAEAVVNEIDRPG